MRIQALGNSRQPMAMIDDFTLRVPEIRACAEKLGPFPPSRNGYPGVRRLITPEDKDASAYITFCLRRLAPAMSRVFGGRGFNCLEASFSLVTTRPAELGPAQRAPHFDSLDPNYLAILHYLAPCAGTAFYRQLSTGIEYLSADNVDRYREAVTREEPTDGYIAGTNLAYAEIGRVAGMPDRVVLYRGSLLHSGVIPEGLAMSPDPKEGRLTANIFVQLQ